MINKSKLKPLRDQGLFSKQKRDTFEKIIPIITYKGYLEGMEEFIVHLPKVPEFPYKDEPLYMNYIIVESSSIDSILPLPQKKILLNFQEQIIKFQGDENQEYSLIGTVTSEDEKLPERQNAYFIYSFDL